MHRCDRPGLSLAAPGMVFAIACIGFGPACSSVAYMWLESLNTTPRMGSLLHVVVEDEAARFPQLL